jgi:hypothetical protein
LQVIKERNVNLKFGEHWQASFETLQSPLNPSSPGAPTPNLSASGTASSTKLEPTDNAVLARFEAEARQQLENLPEDGVDRLLRGYADFRRRGSHEWTYNRIFGSQIRLLEAANQAGGALPIAQVQELYGTFSEALPASVTRPDFENWLSFLTSTGYATISEAQFALTDLGKDFLVYMPFSGLSPHNRPW